MSPLNPIDLAEKAVERIAAIRSKDRRENATRELIERLAGSLGSLVKDGDEFAYAVYDSTLRKYERLQAEVEGIEDWKQREDAYAKANGA